MKSTCLALLVLLVAALPGCGSEPDQAAAAAKCEQFKTTFCGRVVACGLEAESDCRSGLAVSIDCGAIVDVSASFDRCLSEMPAFSCAVLANGDTPASCAMVLLK